MRVEVLKDFTVVHGKNRKVLRAGRLVEAREVGLSEKSLTELQSGGFLRVEKVPPAPAPSVPDKPATKKEGK